MIVGGGLAGLAAATRLGDAGFTVEVHEARPFLGGRAASLPLRPGVPDSERIDNCQHVLLRRCTALLDFYRRCGVEDKIRFHDTLYLVSPGGAVDRIRSDMLPAPLHLVRSLLAMRCLGWRDKVSLLRCMGAVRRARLRDDLDQITFSQWLQENRATPLSVARFWRPFTVSALNEEPDHASALPALQVFGEGLLSGRTAYEMGVPSVTLDELYPCTLTGRLGPNVKVLLQSKVNRIDPDSGKADYFISTVPFDRVSSLLPDLRLDAVVSRFQSSPITGIHLWFERPITTLEHAMLLDRQIQWMFHKGGGYYLIVVSASRGLEAKSTAEIVQLAVSELQGFFPAARDVALVHSRVIREARATYSARPGVEGWRPGPSTRLPNVFLAGDWTATGWPATMEGAVRSGYAAAEAVLKSAGPRTGQMAGRPGGRLSLELESQR